MLEWMSSLGLCVDDVGMAGGVGRKRFSEVLLARRAGASG